ncbi:MAG TPA: hypothetical protein DIT98_01740, partial [Verrucomicrobiales bacterium]|nr:hypothetical protein [Verrucomicrobiales bacterium]
MNDTYSVDEDNTLTVVVGSGVLANDSLGGDGGLLEVSSSDATNNGTLTLNADGGFVYTPNAGFVGIDTFTYSISDVDGDIETALVSIEVLLATPPKPTIILDENITADDKINAIEESGFVNVSGRVGGDASPGDPVVLEFEINGVTRSFESVVDLDKTFSIQVPGGVLTTDDDKTIRAIVSASNEFGTGTGEDTDVYQVDTEIIALLTLDPIGASDGSNEIAKAAALGLTIPVSGAVGSDVSDGDEIIISINGSPYTGLALDGRFVIDVPALELLQDSDQALDASVTISDDAQNQVTASDIETYDVVPVFISRFTDNFVNGITYSTSSKLNGLTGDAGADGAFFYRPTDTIEFTIGDVVLGEFPGTAVKSDILFIQDIAGIGLNDTNDNYLENMAIFLQALDDDVQDGSPDQSPLETNALQNSDESFSSNINITTSVRELFTGYVDADFDEKLSIATSGKKMISNALAHAGTVYTRQSEESPDKLNVFETVAIRHVTETIQELAGDRGPVLPDDRLVDKINVPPVVIDYQFNVLSGEIDFNTDDLLRDAVGQQVRTESIEIVDVRLSEKYQDIGVIKQRGNGDYFVELSADIDPYALEAMSMDYRVYDWTASLEVQSKFRDLFKSHLSAEINDVPEDVGFAEFTLRSELEFESEQALNIEFVSESLGELLGVDIAEYGDDFLVPIQFTVDDGVTWNDMGQSGINLNEAGSPMPVFGFVLPANKQSIGIRIPIFDDFKVESDELILMNITGESVYEENLSLTIIDNDPTNSGGPLLAVNYVYILENGGEAVYTVTMSEPSANNVGVDYSTVSLGIALPGVDYEVASGRIEFPSGSTSQQIIVPVIDDSVIEASPNPEMAIIELSNPENAVIGDKQGTLRVFDDDGPSTLDTFIDVFPITGDNIIDEEEALQDLPVSGVVDNSQFAIGFVTLTINGANYQSRVSSNGVFSFDIPGIELSSDEDLTVDATIVGLDLTGQKASASTIETYILFIDVSPVASDDALTVDEDQTLTLDAPGVLVNDVIGSNGGVLQVLNSTEPVNGNLAINADGSLLYTPNVNFNGIDAFTYEIADSDGDIDTGSVSILVNPVDDVPDAVEDIYFIDEDGSLNVTVAEGVLKNDLIGGDGGTLEIVSTNPPANGTLNVNPDGSFNYTPNVNFNGSDSFTYTITDANGTSDTATVVIVVNSVNDTPEANDDEFTIDEDDTLSVPEETGVLANDSVGGDGGTLEVVDHTQGENGNVILTSTGVFIYVPEPNFHGVERIDYTIQDADGTTDTATITIVVNAVNDIPELAADALPEVLGEGPEHLWSLEDGQTPVLNLKDAFGDQEGDTLVFTADGLPAGMVIDPGTGIISGQLESSASEGGPLGDGVYQILITVDDGNGGTRTFAFEIVVGNPAPIANNDTYSVDEDGVLDLAAPGVMGNDTDPDGDGIKVDALLVDPAHGVGVIQEDGGLTYIPNADFNGQDILLYQISDSDGQTAVASVAVTVNAVNDLPELVADALPEVLGEGPSYRWLLEDGQTPVLNLKDAFGDQEGDTLVFTAVGLPPGMVIDPGTGIISGQLESSASEGGPLGDGVYQVLITVDDGNGGTRTFAFEIVVGNPAPIANNDTYSVDEDGVLDLAAPGVMSNDTDPDGDGIKVD